MQVFLSNTNNLNAIIWFQVFQATMVSQITYKPVDDIYTEGFYLQMSNTVKQWEAILLQDVILLNLNFQYSKWKINKIFSLTELVIPV